MTKRQTFVLGLLCFLPCVWSYKSYKDFIPNGVRVPHPCKNNYLWHGVGHINSQGGGSRNVFGIAFAKANHTWTVDLCQKTLMATVEQMARSWGTPGVSGNVEAHLTKLLASRIQVSVSHLTVSNAG
ncbi:temptin-like [Pomacea canaliculata]|uniref:temptin-like n=1 Tax=Pomacea canaliculata TaxID=400727 RepID=UPI000D72E8DE|nr:temptin-like [Pomacea canaliculata]